MVAKVITLGSNIRGMFVIDNSMYYVNVRYGGTDFFGGILPPNALAVSSLRIGGRLLSYTIILPSFSSTVVFAFLSIVMGADVVAAVE